MKLITKTILIVSTTLVVMLSFFYLFVNQTLLANYAQLEARAVQRDLQRIRDAVHYEAEILSSKTADWATWNETYQFVQDHNQAYIENNLSNDELATLTINLMIFVDRQQQIVDFRTDNMPAGWEQAILFEFLHAHPNLLTHATPESAIYGLITLPKHVLIVASRPVIRNDGTGPIQGSLLFARLVDEQLIKDIIERLQLDANFFRLEQAYQVSKFTPVLEQLVQGQKFVIHPQNNNIVYGFTLLRDIDNQPNLFIHLSHKRTLYQQGRQLVQTFLLALSSFGLIFLGITLGLLQGTVLSRLLGLVKDVQQVTQSDNIHAQVQVSGRDELTTLSQEINTMLKALSEKTQALSFEKDKSEQLLYNILPQPIAQRMKQGETMIAEHFDAATILFSDIVGFTQMAAMTTPTALVEILNRIFSEFDYIADKFNLEKIKTIGDAYMVVAGIPTPQKVHVELMALMALEMCDMVMELNKVLGMNLSVRIGMASGEVVAGIIGKRKFAYDLWGDVVNTAARMESHGQAGRIHCTEAIYHQLKDKFEFEARGTIEVKGKGAMPTYFLICRKAL
ncbi:MAG: adenylate/guanylate cyclase domain-containing protein [Pseudomonadota bacterium]|nr:adenylate/guanylate cyclase domain-containing protein [Pseudomonadota bacterium]